MRYVPAWRSSRSKLLRVLPFAGFCGATGCPSGPRHRQRVDWHRALVEREQIVGHGRIHGHPAAGAREDGLRRQQPRSRGLAGRGRQHDEQRGEFSRCEVFMCCFLSRIERQRHGAELFAAAGGFTFGSLDRPLERNAHRFASTDFAHGFTTTVYWPGLEPRQRRLRRVELQQVLADGTSRAGQAIDRNLQITAAAAPPLAQIRQPLGVIAAHLVPDREIGGDGSNT